MASKFVNPSAVMAQTGLMRGEVVADFRVADLYTDEFITDLEDGLRKSSYAKKYAHQTAQKRR